jgi:hypothetical protein
MLRFRRRAIVPAVTLHPRSWCSASVTIYWPSGKTQTLANVAANQILNVQEP